MEINILDAVNSMPVSNKEKEELVLTMIDDESKDWTFIYEGDKIKHIQYNGVIKQMEMTIKLDEEGLVND